jgi:hypothetical protein
MRYYVHTSLSSLRWSKFIKLWSKSWGVLRVKRTFSTLTFMKTRPRNKFCEHLDLVVYMFAQPFYIIDYFPYNDAIIAWTNEKA